MKKGIGRDCLGLMSSRNRAGSESRVMNQPLLQQEPTSDNGERYFRAFESPKKEGSEKPLHPSNVIVTSRYNIISFIPKSLFEQFRRLANVYFLVLGIIAYVAVATNLYATAVEPQGMLLPLIVVVTISVMKDGWEDIKRHRMDAKVDAKPAREINKEGQLVTKKWKDLQVGSVLLLLCDDEAPADIVVLTSGGVQGPTSYVETAAIDGETNLKVRIPSFAAALSQITKPSKSKDRVEGIDSIASVSLRAEAPNSSIPTFNGSLDYSENGDTKQVALSEKNLILRGSIMRATEWCIGVVVYTGKDTKLALNSKSPPSKLSSIDRIVNKTLLIAIFTMVLVTFLSMVCQLIWMYNNGNAKYLCLNENDLDYLYPFGGCDSSVPNPVLSILTFATLYNNFVCISMYVSLEMCYIWQAWFINNDEHLYDDLTDTRAVVHNSGLCADLGQIEYVLSDKTGTLTKNNMKVKRCTVEGVIYGAPIAFPGSPSPVSNTGPSSAQTAKWSPLENLEKKNPGAAPNSVEANFLRNLAICNSVMLMPDQTTGALNVTDHKSLMDCMQAESPDEVALVEIVAEVAGVVLTQRESTQISVSSSTTRSGNLIERFELLAVNEFESNRKRMSILVRPLTGEANGGSVLFCKGADSSMLPRCKQSRFTDTCVSHIDAFAKTGLRTLIMTRRVLDDASTQKWLATYKKASNSISNRSELLAECADAIEDDMEMLGAVGIEDELQDDVSGTIRTIREAGINTWMITGDKPETAMAIGRLSGLLLDDHTVISIVGVRGADLTARINEVHKFVQQLAVPHLQRGQRLNAQSSKCCSACASMFHTCIHFLGMDPADGGDPDAEVVDPDLIKQGTSKLALVIDGISLEGIWAPEGAELKTKFTEAARLIPTVIASRVSPLQKATLVRMVKTGAGSPVTLAVGDGANDVGMIHEARVGVGISGKEGRHASNAADFAIGQFRFLAPLLIQHGRFNYVRSSKLVLYSFFKNLVLVSALFYYNFYCGISGQIFVDSLVLSGFNFYLGLPIMVIGAMDWDITRQEAMAFPALAYAQGRKREDLNMYTFARNSIVAFIEGLIIFALAVRFITGNLDVTDAGPAPLDKYDINSIGMTLNNGQGGGLYAEGFTLFSIIVVTMSYKVIAVGTFNWIGAALWTCSLLGYFFFAWVYNLIEGIEWFGVVTMAMSSPIFYLALLIVPIFIVIFDTLAEYTFAYFYPTSRDILREVIKQRGPPSEFTGPTSNPIFPRQETIVSRSSMDSNDEQSKASHDPFPRMLTEDFSPLTTAGDLDSSFAI
jgi:phospholipid-transporting ATPase